MKNNMRFIKHIKLGRILSLAILLFSIFFVYSISFDYVNETDKVSDVSYEILNNNTDKDEVLENLGAYKFSAFSDLKTKIFKPIIENDVLVKVSIDPIYEKYSYMLVNLNDKYRDCIQAYNSDGEKIQSASPEVISYNPQGEFVYYPVSESDEPTNIYVYIDKGYKLGAFNKPFFLVGTESELLLTQWSKSVPEFLISIALLIVCVFLFLIFYAIVVDEYLVARLFSISFLLVALQCLICSPGVSFTFNEYSNLLYIIEIILYLLISAVTFAIPMVYAINSKIKRFYKYNIIACAVIVIIVFINGMVNNSLSLILIDIFDWYFIVISLYSILLNIRDFEDEKESLSIIRILAFFSLVVINLTFFIYETRSLIDSYRIPYYFILIMYSLFSLAYIGSIFLHRSKYAIDAKTFISEEKLIIDRISKSSKISITNTDINKILKNILDDIKMLYPNCDNILILKKDANKNISVIENYNFSEEQYNINYLFKKYFKKTKKLSFTTHFNGSKAALSFKSIEDESFLILIANSKNLTDIDEMVGRILVSSILVSFDNCMTYENIYEVEQQFLLSIGTLIGQKSGMKNTDYWRIGEYCYNLGKIFDMTENEARRFRSASYLVDIGKIALADEYYNFDTILASERQTFYSHTTIGYEILSKMNNKTMNLASICALNHHERFDGKGYLGKYSKDIPIYARIFSVCDMFENTYIKICSEKSGISISEAVRETYNLLALNADVELDADIVEEFIGIRKTVEQIIRKSEIRKLND